MKRIATVAAAAMLVASSAAMAQGGMTQGEAGQSPAVTHVRTASDLAAVCDPAGTGVPRLEAIAYCQGFLTSAGQYHALLHPANSPMRPLFCAPNPGPTVAQSGIAFARWVRENPSYNAEPALDALLRWAQASFPCAPATPTARAPRAHR
ncbi:MAG: hypothetical protein JWR10_3025 [Rubritepida sp.]|nr:hypothetical protein [Rubritepida sp.]